MSRIGKKPITIPKGVTIKMLDREVEVQGPKGKMRLIFPAGINFEMSDGSLVARRSTDDPGLAKFHGLARTLVANAVTGVTASSCGSGSGSPDPRIVRASACSAA